MVFGDSFEDVLILAPDQAGRRGRAQAQRRERRCVEIDPAILRLAAEHPDARTPTACASVADDAHFLRTATKKYDWWCSPDRLG